MLRCVRFYPGVNSLAELCNPRTGLTPGKALRAQRRLDSRPQSIMGNEVLMPRAASLMR